MAISSKLDGPPFLGIIEPPISVTAPRLPSLDGFSDKVGGGGAMSEASLGYPRLLCLGRYCSATEMFNNADYGDMIATTEEFFKFLFESRNDPFWQNQLTLVGEFTGRLARGGYKHFPDANSYSLNVALGHADVSTLFGIYANQLNGVHPVSEFQLYGSPYRFVGSYTLNPDRFDADRSNRPFLQEWMTTRLREIGSVFGHTDYQIYFTGEKEISFSGRRPVQNAETRPPQAVHRPSFGGLMRPGRR
ncbi:hypothetical protein [Burkholderia ubonensis]|uniref:hypothetical protein n=1 Tax=Burkholderia ubonensis TaxID=101571 RepID=UPI000AECD867|nr:hypothetical protein [Burkholderia ubonensis]